MHEDPEVYDVEVERMDAPPTMTILVQRSRGVWTCKCAPPPEIPMGTITARGESLSEALSDLADLVEDWEENNDEDDDDALGAAFDDED